MRYLFRGLIRETGKTVEGAVDADTPEDALTALSANGIVTEDLTPAPIPISSLSPSARADFVPASAGRAGAPPVPPGARPAAPGHPPAPFLPDHVPAQQIAHPGANSEDALDRAFAASSQAVSFDQVAQRYKGKSVWVIDRDKIRRQVAVVVDQTLQKAEKQNKGYDGDQVREDVAAALKDLFKDNRNIASQKSPEEARAEQQAQQQAAAAAAPPAPAGGTVQAVSTPELAEQIGRLEAFLTKAETVLTQLQVAARRVGSGGGGGVGFGPARMSHIPRPKNDEQSDVLMQIFKQNVKLRDNINKKKNEPAPPAGEPNGNANGDAAPASEPAST